MRLSLAITSILVATSLLAVPAVAAPLGAAVPKSITAQTQNGDEPLVTPVQYRRGYRGGYRHHDGGDDGAGIAAGIIGGLMLGAIIASPSITACGASAATIRTAAPISAMTAIAIVARNEAGCSSTEVGERPLVRCCPNSVLDFAAQRTRRCARHRATPE